MLNPKVKLKHEAHYWTTDQTGTRVSNFESLHLKAIWYPSQGGKWGSWKYKPAIGLGWIKGWGNDDLVLGYRSIGSSADQLGPSGPQNRLESKYSHFYAQPSTSEA